MIAKALHNALNVLRLGFLIEGAKNLVCRITEAVFNTHVVIFGRTGQGKSKLIQHFCRQHFISAQGFAVIDPHDDLVDDIIADIAFHFDDLGCQRSQIHILKPAEQPFSFDPFEYHPDPDDPHAQDEQRYQAWLSSKIKDVVKIVLRKQGETADEQEKMVRLKRWLGNGLWAVGVRHDASGTHLPLFDMFALLNPLHSRHDELWERVRDLVPEHVRADFEMLRLLKRNPKDVQHFVESTTNRLRDIFSPIVERIFSLEAPSINFREIIRRNGIILVGLAKTEHFNEEEGQVIAGLIIREINASVRTIPRKERRRFFLYVDEAQNYLNEDFELMLKEGRKYGLTDVLGIQQPDNLQKGDLDLFPTVISQCGIRITFQQQYEEDAMTLAKSMCYSMLDFTELLHEVDQDAGYRWYFVPSVTSGESQSTTIQVGRSMSTGHSVAKADGTTLSHQVANSVGHSHVNTSSEAVQHRVSHTKGTAFGTSVGRTCNHAEGISGGNSETAGGSEHSSRSEGLSHSSGATHVMGAAQTVQGGPRLRTTDARNRSAAQNESTSNSVGLSQGQSKSYSIAKNQGWHLSDSVGSSVEESRSQSHGLQHGTATMHGSAVSVGQTNSRTTTRGEAHSNTTTNTDSVSRSKSLNRGQTSGFNHSVTMQLTPLHQAERKVQKTGKFETAIADQQTIHAHQIQSLRPQHCLVSIASFSSAFFLRVDDVFDPFAEAMLPPGIKEKAVANLKSIVYGQHPYYLPLDGRKIERSQRSPGGNERPDEVKSVRHVPFREG